MQEANTVRVESGEGFFRETRVEYSGDKQPTHQSRGKQHFLARWKKASARWRFRCSDTTPPSHKRVLIWRAIAIQGILRQALTRISSAFPCCKSRCFFITRSSFTFLQLFSAFFLLRATVRSFKS